MFSTFSRVWRSVGGRGWMLRAAGKAQQIKFRCHCQWSGNRRKQKPHFMLYGMVAFMWERERITNEDVVSCLREYVGRVSDNLSSAKPQESQDTNQSPSTAANVESGYFSWLYSSNTNTTEVASTTEESSSSFPWNYLSWAQSMVTWSTPAPDSTAVVDRGEPAGVSEVADPAAEMERRKQEEFVSECFRYYTAHSEERKAQLPLVGLPKRRGDTRQLTLALRMLENIEEKTRTAVLNVLSSPNPSLSTERTGYSNVRVDSEVVSSLSDLACIEDCPDVKPHPSVPALHSEDWVRSYMQVELMDERVPDTTPSHTDSVQQVNRKPLHSLVQTLKPLMEDAKSLMVSSQHYLVSQFLLEESFSVNQALSLDKIMSVLPARAQSFALSSARHFASHLVMEEVLSVDETFGVLCCEENRNTIQPENTPEVQETTNSSSSTSDSTGGTDSGSSWNWEFITRDHNYAAYRKYYQDTELFQYKVIGHYDDITARDFFEAQVDHEYRKSWDVYAGDMVTVDTDQDSNCELVHWVMKYPFPMSDREYLFVQKSWVSDNNNTIVIMKRSVSHPDFPDKRKTVRVNDYFSDMVIKSHSRIDELGMDFELTYFDNPKTNLPSSCTNWVASTAMPDFMNKIHGAARRKQQSKL